MTDDRDIPDAAGPYPRRERAEALRSEGPVHHRGDPVAEHVNAASFQERMTQAGLAPELLPGNRRATLAQEPLEAPEPHQDATHEENGPPWPSWSGWEDVE